MTMLQIYGHYSWDKGFTLMRVWSSELPLSVFLFGSLVFAGMIFMRKLTIPAVHSQHSINCTFFVPSVTHKVPCSSLFVVTNTNQNLTKPHTFFSRHVSGTNLILERILLKLYATHRHSLAPKCEMGEEKQHGTQIKREKPVFRVRIEWL